MLFRSDVAQQAQYPHRKSALHSTTYRSHPRSYHDESPRPAGLQAEEPQALAGQQDQVPQQQPRQAARQCQGHKQLWTAPGQGEQQMGNPPWFQQQELVKSHGRVPYQIIKHQGQFMLHQHHRWRVLGVLQIPSEQNHIQISSKNLVKFQIMTLAWILKHGSIVMRWL